MARILIVDDEADMRAVERLALELAGHEVVEATGGLDALFFLKTPTAFDAVICDVMMPGLNGLKLCRLVRLDPALRHIVFIFVSGRYGEEERLEGIHAGADDYIRKPFAVQELWLRVNHHLLKREGEQGAQPGPDPLVQFSLPQFIALIVQHKLTGRLKTVTRFKDQGIIFYEHGRAVHATFKQDTGRPAMRNIIASELASFSFEANETSDQITMALNISQAITAGDREHEWPSVGEPSGGHRDRPREAAPARWGNNR